MRRVQAVPPGGGGGERGDLLGPGVHARGVDEAARHADRAGIERLVDIRDHRRQLGLARAAAVRAEDGAADRAVPDEERDVRPERLRVDGVEEPGDVSTTGRAERCESAASIARAGGFSGANVYPQLPESCVV